MKKTHGITLIALIITIIIMLILVSVSINIALNTGLFKSAGDATKNWKSEQDTESSMNEITIDGKSYASVEDYINGKEKLPEGAGTRYDKTEKYTDGTQTATIPAGFTVSGIGSETTIDGGLVIYLLDQKENGDVWTNDEIANIDWSDKETVDNLQKNYDQFVWIPIPKSKINDMFICQGKGQILGEDGNPTENALSKCNIIVQENQVICINEYHQTSPIEATETNEAVPNKATQMAGRLYAVEEGNKFKESITEVYSGTNGLREPKMVQGRRGNCDSSQVNLNAIALVTGDNDSYTDASQFEKTLQNEYNEIVKSIYNENGFWVGRYGTSNITKTDNTAVKIIGGANLVINQVNWYYMYGQQKAYSANKQLSGVKSNMILGTCYDQMLEFVDATNHKIKQGKDVENNSLENYNIYNLDGIVQQWTTEAGPMDTRISRGLNFNESNLVSCRAGLSPIETKDWYR